jgi:hypothetical protein
MCHLCRKVETLKEPGPKTVKPIVALLSLLHKKIEPQLAEFWFQRYEQIVKLRTLLIKLHDTLPVPLRDMLDNIDHELHHIRKNMLDHPPQLSSGRLNLLKETISPSSSASHQIVKHTLPEAGQERNRPQEVHKRRRTGSRNYQGISENAVEGKHLPELPGSDIGPPPARMQQSIRKVEEWFRRCELVTVQ